MSNAYETIKEPGARRIYDTKWGSIKQNARAKEEKHKRETETTETEQKKATEENVEKQRQASAQQKGLQNLYTQKCRHEGDVFENNRVVRKLVADLKRLQDQDNDEKRKERERNSWWTFVIVPIHGEVKETEEQKRIRETERLQRRAGRSIKEGQLAQKEAVLQRSRDALDEVNSKIAALKEQEEEDARRQAVKRQEQLRKAEETRRQQQIREAWAKREEERMKLQAAQAAKVAREAKAAREAQEAWEAQERVRLAAAKEKIRAELEKRAQAKRRAEAASIAAAARGETLGRDGRYRPAGLPKSTSRASASNGGVCQHGKFWPKIEGRHSCSICHITQKQFAFRCPDCKMVACASCRQTLRGEKGKSNRNSGRRFDHDVSHNTGFGDFDHDYEWD